jgi:predicted solute-binding protein
LLKVVLAEFHDLSLELGRTPGSLQKPGRLIPVRHSAPGLKHRAHEEARLLIGNQAIDFRLANPEGWEYLDLGTEWKRCTGLPFVFALWLMRPTLPNAAEIAAELRDIKYDGIAHISEIVASDTEHTSDVSIPYLTEFIRFGCGPREKAGLDKFRELLEKHEFIERDGPPLRFV